MFLTHLIGIVRDLRDRWVVYSQWSHVRVLVKQMSKAISGGKALIVPCDPWGVVGSRGDQAMILACLQHVRAAHPDRVVDVLTDSHDTDAPCRELGLNPVVAWREPLDVWFTAHAGDYAEVYIPGADVTDGVYGWPTACKGRREGPFEVRTPAGRARMTRFASFAAALVSACVLFGADWIPVTVAGRTVQLQRTEVSNAEYCAFLNAVARTGDVCGLWNPLMADHFWGGIVRTRRADGAWSYAVKPGYVKKPATCMPWTACARYCNWLAYGRPDTGRAELGTTEGDARNGVYDTAHFEDAAFVRGTGGVARRSSESYFLPSADEWRAAASAGPDVGTVNVYDGHWALPNPHLADIDQGTTNALGFVNLCGNVAEWVETRRGNFFLALGGSLIRGPYSTRSDFSEGDECDKAISSFGFRVARAEHPVVLPGPHASVIGQSADRALANQPANQSCADGPFNQTIKQTDNQTIPDPWVRIGNPGNARDPVYRVGRVNYEFEMARHQVTNAEWCEFMNAVGVEKSISLGLYNPDMSTGVCGGIDLVTSPNASAPDPGACTNQTIKQFRSKTGWSARPVVYVGYRDAMRYCNWLQTGDTEKGAYDLEHLTCRRLPGAKYFIPSDNEWCKAAYHDPTRLGSRKYWDYPCRTSDLPPNDPALPHACNYLKDGVYLGEKGPFYLAVVDAYPTSDTYYGCRQMAGNVWEWVEPVATDKLNLRGGSFGYTEFGMGIWNRDEAGFEDELNVFGLRIARAVANPKVVKGGGLMKMKELLQDASSKTLMLVLCGLILLVLVLGFVLGRYWGR